MSRPPRGGRPSGGGRGGRPGGKPPKPGSTTQPPAPAGKAPAAKPSPKPSPKRSPKPARPTGPAAPAERPVYQPARLVRESTAPFADVAVTFVGSFPDPQVRLDPPLPEVAVIGRSNVGKSSLLNALTGIPGLARVSSTPGKTSLVNVFRLPEFHLVDLPGYGFAQAGKAVRLGYQKLITRYLTERTTLRGIVWLLDSRHSPSKDDYAFQTLLAESGRAVLVVLTKADKLGREAQKERTRLLGIELDVPDDQLLLISSNTGQGLDDLAASIRALVTSS